MKSITVKELQQLRESGEDFQLIDVREQFEYEIADMQGELIPLNTVPDNVDKISRTKKVIVHCKGGGRSGRIIQWLEENHEFDNLYNLEGGITAWANEIDPNVPKY